MEVIITNYAYTARYTPDSTVWLSGYSTIILQSETRGIDKLRPSSLSLIQYTGDWSDDAWLVPVPVPGMRYLLIKIISI